MGKCEGCGQGTAILAVTVQVNRIDKEIFNLCELCLRRRMCILPSYHKKQK